MASERDYELLDDYLGNRLDDKQRKAFEASLQGDPELQREVRVQQDIVQSIRSARKAELKQMLNNIPASALPSETSAVAKWTGIAVAVIVALGLYFFLQPETEKVVSPTKSDTMVQGTTPENTDASEQASPEEESQPVIETDPAPAEQRSSASPSAKPQMKEPATAAPATKPQIDVFDPSEEEQNESSPTAGLHEKAAQRKKASDITSEVVNDNKQYKFHYQFNGDKLILYGDFNTGLYEILEFFADNKRTVFLSYKDSYYLLKQDGDKVKPLAALHDPALIRRLNEYQHQE